MIDEKFSEAGSIWDLSRLYADLAEAKRICNNSNRSSVTLSDVEAACLRGILCGYSPRNIAIDLNRDITGLRVDLSRNLYAYIEEAAGQRPVNWRQIPFLLERSGYRLNIAAAAAESSLRQDLGVMIDTYGFCGREPELNTLQHWIKDPACHVIPLVGMGGIGKTALAAKLVQMELTEAKPPFEGVIWRSLRYAPPVTETLSELLQFVYAGEEIPSNITSTSTIDQQISLLLSRLRQHRFLIVLDDWESILREGEWAGYCAKEHEGYGRLLQRLAMEQHQSCLLLISREQPIEVTSLISQEAAVRRLKLKGLPLPAAKELLSVRGLELDETGLPELVEIHRGNPAAILRAAMTIQDLFDGSIAQFLSQTSLVLGDVLLNLLEQQFTRLSDLERTIIFWLAVTGQPMSIADLRNKLDAEDRSQLLTALDSLRRRSLMEKIRPMGGSREALFALEPVVMKYVVQQFITQFCQDLCSVLKDDVLKDGLLKDGLLKDGLLKSQSIAQLGLVGSHLLVDETQGDGIHFYQAKRILSRICDRLRTQLGGDGEQLGDRLATLLIRLRERDHSSIGYAEINVEKLLEIINL